jgi:flagellar export protein FliJ
MPVSRALRRLLRIREIEEEQCRTRLEAASADLHRLQAALAATAERDRRGRQMVAASAHSGELPDRLAGMEETRTAARFAEFLQPRIAEQELVVARLRQEFLQKRVEHRQVETLIEEAQAKDAIEADRRSQQMLDDWFNARKVRGASQSRARGKAAAGEETLFG